MSVAEIAAAAGAELQAAPGAREIESIEIDAAGAVCLVLVDGTRFIAAAPGEVPESRRRPGVLLSGPELVSFYQRRGALPVPVRPGKLVRRRVLDGAGRPAIVFGEVGR